MGDGVQRREGVAKHDEFASRSDSRAELPRARSFCGCGERLVRLGLRKYVAGKVFVDEDVMKVHLAAGAVHAYTAYLPANKLDAVGVPAIVGDICDVGAYVEAFTPVVGRMHGHRVVDAPHVNLSPQGKMVMVQDHSIGGCQKLAG